MPNHVKNRITLKGTVEAVKALVDAYMTIHPEHENAAHDGTLICKKTNGNDGQEWGYLNKETNDFTTRDKELFVGLPEGWEIEINPEVKQFPDFEKVIPMPQEVKDTSGDSGVSPGWYTWSLNNWGTKWNSYSCENPDENVFEFETAWASPINVIEHMGLMHPDVEILLEYADEDFGYNCGKIVFHGGVVSDEEFEGGTLEAQEFAISLRPDILDYMELVDGEYQYTED